MGSSESFQIEFENSQEQLPEAVNYHNRLQQMQKWDEIVSEEIDKRRSEMEQEDDGAADGYVPHDPPLQTYPEAQDGWVWGSGG